MTLDSIRNSCDVYSNTRSKCLVFSEMPFSYSSPEGVAEYFGDVSASEGEAHVVQRRFVEINW